MKRLKRYLIIASIVAVVILGIRFTQELEDLSRLATYRPSSEITRLATSTTMTPLAKRFFYVNNPTIEAKKLSLNLCKTSEHTIVLGCYVVRKGIFLQEVNDPRLKGVMEVTAAHEMLHVVYQRMSIFEQSQINKQLQQALSKLQNPRILKLVATYNNQDPRSVDNELQSIDSRGSIRTLRRRIYRAPSQGKNPQSRVNNPQISTRTIIRTGKTRGANHRIRTLDAANRDRG
jgi:hypothetical protein